MVTNAQLYYLFRSLKTSNALNPTKKEAEIVTYFCGNLEENPPDYIKVTSATSKT